MALGEQEISAKTLLNGEQVIDLVADDVLTVEVNGTPVEALGYTVPTGKVAQIRVVIQGTKEDAS